MPPTPQRPKPVSPDAPALLKRALLTQEWLDLAFVHWAVDPSVVAGLLPDGTTPDVLDGVTYVGLVAFRMHRVGWLWSPGVPYLGSFPETNVRLYSVDAHGRRGVVFRSMDAGRLGNYVGRSRCQRPGQDGNPRVGCAYALLGGGVAEVPHAAAATARLGSGSPA